MSGLTRKVVPLMINLSLAFCSWKNLVSSKFVAILTEVLRNGRKLGTGIFEDAIARQLL
jgi:hypothetical protein